LTSTSPKWEVEDGDFEGGAMAEIKLDGVVNDIYDPYPTHLHP